MTTAVAARTRPFQTKLDHTTATLAEEHATLLRGVQCRAAAVDALIGAHAWPHSELATLTGFLRTALLRQVSDEEHLLYPHDATAAPFAELSSAHAQLYELTERLEGLRQRPAPLRQLRELLDELLSTLRKHLTEEEAVLATLAATGLDVPATATLSELRKRWPSDRDDGPLVIQFDALPTAIATRLCIERVLRLRPGEQAVIFSDDQAQLHDVRAWLHEFDPARFALAMATDCHGRTRLEVSCRDPR